MLLYAKTHLLSLPLSSRTATQETHKHKQVTTEHIEHDRTQQTREQTEAEDKQTHYQHPEWVLPPRFVYYYIHPRAARRWGSRALQLPRWSYPSGKGKRPRHCSTIIALRTGIHLQPLIWLTLSVICNLKSCARRQLLNGFTHYVHGTTNKRIETSARDSNVAFETLPGQGQPPQ